MKSKTSELGQKLQNLLRDLGNAERSFHENAITIQKNSDYQPDDQSRLSEETLQRSRGTNTHQDNPAA